MPSNGQQVALPEQLRLRFAALERRLWRVETAIAICSVVASLLASWFVLFVSDRIWATPVWLRALLFAVGIAISAVAVWRWVDRWVWHKRDQRELAVIVQKKYRKLGDRLLGIVELAGEQEHSANFSPALYRAAIEQVANEAVSYDFPASVSGRKARKFSLVAGALVGCLLLAGVILPAASWNSLLRWMLPGAGIPRYTLVTLDGFPSELIVAHGEAFDVTGHVHYRSFWKPGKAIAEIGKEPKISTDANGGNVQLHVPGQVENGALVVRVGDAEARVRILPTLRPAVKDLSASIQLPEYLRYPSQQQKLNSGALLTVEGSRAAFAGKMTRPLAAANMSNESGNPVPLTIRGDDFSTEATSVDGVSHFTMTWRDNLGLTNAAPLRLSVQTQKDQPPVPDLPELPRDCGMLASDVLTVRLEARDDFGVRDLGLMWDFSAENTNGGGTAVTEVKVQTESPHEKRAEHSFKWSPSLFRIPPDSMVELQGYARDYFPERERIRTPPYRIRVLSPEQHAELLRQRLEALMSSSEEVTRTQEKVVANTRDAKENSKITPSQQTARIGQTKDDQNRNANDLQNLAKQGERVLQEAMKNPIFKEDMVQKWGQTLRQWQDLANQKMNDAAKSMQSAQQNQNSESRQQDLAKALQKAQEALEALQKTQQKAAENLDQLQALTLSERLRRAGARETEISGDLQKSAQQTVGLLPSELPEALKQADVTLATGQQTVQQEASKLQTEISRFAERTSKPNYSEVSKAMKEARTADELDRLGSEIRDNIVLQSASDLDEWSKRFEDWAGKLQPKEDSGGGDSKGGGQQKKMDMTKTLVALLRLREGQLTLRDQTTLLEKNHGSDVEYKDSAKKLASTQKEITEKLDGLEHENQLPSLEAPYVETFDAMHEAQQLLEKPQTDKTTDDAQVKSVDLLTDLINLINEQAKRSSPQSQPQEAQSQASAEDMAFLMQMMKNAQENKSAPMPNSGPGGNTAGGSANRPGGPITGSTQGKGAAARNVSKATGVIENAPAEFRDALENYYKGIENNTRGTQ